MSEKMLYARSDGRLSSIRSHDSVGKWLLLDHADAPEDVLVRAYATVIGNYCDAQGQVFIPALGMQLPVFRGLLATYFPRFIAPIAWLNEQSTHTSNEGALCEFPDLVELLLEHRAVVNEHHRCIAHLVASACMGNDHLWQDLGLPNRIALSVLLTTHFPTLAARNTGDMKWKKFFYKQLCEREGFNACRAPSCAACIDYDKCFGPED